MLIAIAIFLSELLLHKKISLSTVSSSIKVLMVIAFTMSYLRKKSLTKKLPMKRTKRHKKFQTVLSSLFSLLFLKRISTRCNGQVSGSKRG